MNEYQMTVMKVAIHPAGHNPAYIEQSTWVEIEDDGEGPYISITQDGGGPDNRVRFDFDEIPMLVKAVDFLREQEAIRKADEEVSKQ